MVLFGENNVCILVGNCVVPLITDDMLRFRL